MQYNNIRMSTDASCIVLNTRSRYNSFHPKPCVNMFYRMMSLLSSCNQWLVLKCLEMHCYYLFNGLWKKKSDRETLYNLDKAVWDSVYHLFRFSNLVRLDVSL